MEPETKIIVECAAHDHALSLHLDNSEGQVYLSIYLGEFYAHQRSLLSRWWERLCMVGTILRGREYLFEDIVLDYKEWDQVLGFLMDCEAEGENNDN